MRHSLIANCPRCNHDQLYKGKAKRPRVTCEKCHYRYYIKTQYTQNHAKNQIEVEGLAPVESVKNMNPRKSSLNKKSNSKTQTSSHLIEPPGSFKNHPFLGVTPLLDPNLFSAVNIKTLLKNSAISDIINDSSTKTKAYDILTKSEFIEQAEIKQGVYWTSDMKPYSRPYFFYNWQNLGIDLMKSVHCMWQASRQKIGKTTGAFNADFEDMLETPGTVVTLVAPGLEQATTLLRQGFKEVITLDDGSKFDLWNQLYAPYFLIDNVKKMVMKNGSILQVIPLSEYTTPGYATDILHIEELDKVVQDPQKLRALGAVLPTIRARRDYAKLRITCNNTSGVYRILREDLKDLYPHVVIYMEKPRPLDTPFTGEHFIYNDMFDYEGTPDIDIILERIMDAIMGEEYTIQQLGNVDDYSGDTFNPDKLDLAYKRGKSFVAKEYYEHVVMHIDPGAIHDFAIGILAMEEDRFYQLWTKTFSVSGKTQIETENMLKNIAKECAEQYVRCNCEYIVSESNSGARLIIPLINHYIRKEIDKGGGVTYAEVNEPIWSNWGSDKERGYDDKKIFPRVDYIMLMQYILNYEMITLQDRNKYEHKQRIEFARYDPIENTTEKYKGNCVDSIMHGAWFLGKGKEYIGKVAGIHEKVTQAWTM